MVPSKVTVAPGTTVKFTMGKGSYETHSASFGPGVITYGASYMGAIGKSFESPAIDPRVLYTSDVTAVSRLLTAAFDTWCTLDTGDTLVFRWPEPTGVVVRRVPLSPG